MDALHCPTCDDEVLATETNRTFEDGSQHIEAKCPNCGKFLKWLRNMEGCDGFKLFFGKYSGYTLKDLLNHDRQYVEWLAKECDYANVKVKAQKVLEKYDE